MENDLAILYHRFSILCSLKARFELGKEDSGSGFFEDHIDLTEMAVYGEHMLPLVTKIVFDGNCQSIGIGNIF